MRDDIRPGEILELLRSKIAGFEPSAGEIETGKVIQAGDGIARVWGLEGIMSGELVEIGICGGKTASGMAMNLEEDTVSIILFSGYEDVKEGCLVRRTGKVAEVPVGEALLGRVVDSLGNPIDGKGPVVSSQKRRVEEKGPGIISRQNVAEALQTGIKAIDAMIPIGRGQRELIIGDRRTGKTAIAIDTIINQKNLQGKEKVYCFYVAIGQKRSSIVQLIENLKKYGVMDYTTIVAATASDPASLQYLAPYAATAMAEYFRDSGRHALVIFDDLTKHSQAYREISLLMRRSPGREAYPGDVFYLHPRLLERAARISDRLGGGSLTALPIVETQEGDVSAYIPTNIISITDGQIFLESDLFNSGLRPAINAGISVSRVGGAAQIKGMKQIASSLRIDLAQFRELAAFMQFSSDLDPATRKQLDRGERLTEILKQPQYAPVDVYRQLMILRAGITGRLDKYPVGKLLFYQKELFFYLDADASGFMNTLKKTGSFNDETAKAADAVLDAFEEKFNPESAGSGIDSGYTVNLAMAMSQRSSRINRDMLKLIERISSTELASPSLQNEIEEIITGQDVGEKDRFEELAEKCLIIDYKGKPSIRNVFKSASAALAESLQNTNEKEVLQKLLEREQSSSTALSEFMALPHIITGGTSQFQMVMVRAGAGIKFTDQHPSVKALFFLAGSMDQRHFHLVVISALAQIVQHPSFESSWTQASGSSELRKIVLSIRRQKGS